MYKEVQLQVELSRKSTRRVETKEEKSRGNLGNEIAVSLTISKIPASKKYNPLPPCLWPYILLKIKCYCCSTVVSRRYCCSVVTVTVTIRIVFSP